jgi:hypothetical protein
MRKVVNLVGSISLIPTTTGESVGVEGGEGPRIPSGIRRTPSRDYRLFCPCGYSTCSATVQPYLMRRGVGTWKKKQAFHYLLLHWSSYLSYAVLLSIKSTLLRSGIETLPSVLLSLYSLAASIYLYRQISEIPPISFEISPITFHNIWNTPRLLWPFLPPQRPIQSLALSLPAISNYILLLDLILIVDLCVSGACKANLLTHRLRLARGFLRVRRSRS